MATSPATTDKKQAPAFYIFDTIETENGKELKRVGAAFRHSKGKGFSVIIEGKRFAAFPPKAKSAPAEGGAA